MSNIDIFLLKKEDLSKFKKEMENSFESPEKFFLNITKHSLVAKQNNSILGGVVLDITKLKKSKIGFISWIFTTKNSRGKGIGKKLLKASKDYLENKGCTEILACIDGSNISSQKLFKKNNFKVLGIANQIERFGVDFFKVIEDSNQLINQGSLIWSYSKLRVKNFKHYDISITIFSNIILGFIIAFSPLNYWINANFLNIILALFLIHLIRFYSSKLTSSILNIKTVFRSWFSGFSASITFSMFGVYFPLPGNFYLKKMPKTEVKIKKKIGILAAFSNLSVLVLIFLSSILINYISSEFVLNTLFSIKYLGISLLFFDMFLIMKPFNNFNGRRIFDFSKRLWVLFILILIMSYFL